MNGLMVRDGARAPPRHEENLRRGVHENLADPGHRWMLFTRAPLKIAIRSLLDIE